MVPGAAVSIQPRKYPIDEHHAGRLTTPLMSEDRRSCGQWLLGISFRVPWQVLVQRVLLEFGKARSRRRGP